MRAWLLDRFEGLGALRLAEVADPAAGAGEVVMEVEYAALNPADRYLAEGHYPARPPLPHILGRDGCGRIVAIGPGVEGLKIGDWRAILRGDVGVSRAGTFAEKVAAPVQSLVEIPQGWTDREAASATLVYLTAYQALTQWGQLPPSVVLISGASGGVGVASIQLARAMGHMVVGLSRSAEKQQRLTELGAATVFDPHHPQWPVQLRQRLGDLRVDLAIDNIGGPLLPQMIDTLGNHGKVSVVGRLAGPVPQFNTASLFFRRIKIGGVAVGAYTNAESRAAWADVLSLLQRMNARPVVDSVFEFDELIKAFERLREGPMGKVLIRANAGQ
jgi:NADPH2:quinone reductase